MTKIDIARAWRDPEYRASLSAAERAQLPEHPAGLVTLQDEDLTDVGGGTCATGDHCTTEFCTCTDPNTNCF